MDTSHEILNQLDLSEFEIAHNFDDFDVSDICLTCLKANSTMPLEKLDVNGKLALDILKMELSVFDSESIPTVLPIALCRTCLRQLMIVHLFKIKAEKAINILKKKLKNESIPKDQFPHLKVEDGFTGSDNIHENPDISDSEVYKEESTQEITSADQKSLNEKNKQTCSFCGKSFAGSTGLKIHLRTHSKEKPYNCDSCGKSFSTIANLSRHKMIHTDDRPYSCEICSKRFRQKKDLLKHQKSHRRTQNGPFTCDICKRELSTFGLLNYHKKHVHKIFANENKSKISNDSDLNQFICEVCGKGFQRRSLIYKHMITHGEKQFSCKECEKKFTSTTRLKIHMIKHTNERPFVCDKCGKKFKSKATLYTHSLIHLGIKPYSCSFCSNTFKQKSQLITHTKTHTGVKDYSCEFCSKSFATNGNLTVHRRIHTGDRPYICDICGIKFIASNSLKKHKTCHKL